MVNEIMCQYQWQVLGVFIPGTSESGSDKGEDEKSMRLLCFSQCWTCPAVLDIRRCDVKNFIT